MFLLKVEIENFKRIVAVRFTLPEHGVTPLVGDNEAGKTSTLDAIAALLAGGKFSPELPIRRGAINAHAVAEIVDPVDPSKNLRITRRWTAKGTSLEITAADGATLKSPQAILDQLWTRNAVDPMSFERLEDKERARILAKIAGVDIDAHERARSALFNRRAEANRVHRDAKIKLDGTAKREAPAEKVNVDALLAELAAAEAKNREADGLARAVTAAERECETANAWIKQKTADVEELKQRLAAAEKNLIAFREKEIQAAEAYKGAVERHQAFEPVMILPIKDAIAKAGAINDAVTANVARAQLAAEVQRLEQDARIRDQELAKLEADHAAAIAKKALPVPGLTFTADGVLIDGIPFTQCSSAQRLRTSVAIGLALNPQLKLLLVRDGSLIDPAGMKLLGEMADAAGAQVLVERVDTGTGETGVRIVEGETVAAA